MLSGFVEEDFDEVVLKMVLTSSQAVINLFQDRPVK